MRRATSLTRSFPVYLLLLAAACSEPAAVPDELPAPAVEPATENDAPLAWRRPGRPAMVREAVGTWNDHIVRFGELAFTSPPNEARMVAMANTAVHDVLNAVDRRFAGLAYHEKVRRPVSLEAAIATAAHDVLVGVGAALPTPAASEYIATTYAEFMAQFDACDEVTRGIELGRAAAAAMLALRAGDGSNQPPVVLFTSTGEAGKFRSTIGTGIALTGVQAIPAWGGVRPFVLERGDQFRAPSVYGVATVEEAVRTPLYLKDYEEVRRLGGVVSERTEEQTEIALFWVESTNRGWARMARILADTRHLNAWRLARLMAHLSLAQADAYIANFDSKYTWNFWRPVTAIRLGNLDPSAAGDPAWEVASVPAGLGGTPPIPEYTSGHSMAGAASGVAILANIPGHTAFTMESPTLPGRPRHLPSVEAAIQENADSRVYVGFHFRQATIDGMEQGKQVGRWVVEHALARAGHRD